MPSLLARHLPGVSNRLARTPFASRKGGPQRDLTASATETVALVLDENSPLPETPNDVACLALRLRGHVSQLGAVVPATDPALLVAQRLSSADPPDGYVPSRVHLVQLARATLVLTLATRRCRTDLPARQSGGTGVRHVSRVTRPAAVVAALIVVILAVWA
ncbi:DUF6415 family natural product biosynthesis protein [Streptomyces sp. NPDC047999]|uniref:DUF6415 family natural product biosynthesis protein n=1 Tax=Streptomyces sp. NPDC047999 TaxID=3365497 RepID=UPI0037128E81